jgi:DNA-binding response OmpR family regulator
LQKYNLDLLKNINALYIDDESGALKEYGKLFELFFRNLYLESSPIEAINTFNILNIQLIIADLKMPQMNGIDFVKEIRKVNKKIPIFIMSAFPDQDSLIEAIGLDLVSFLIKPVNYNKIKESLLLSLEKIVQNNILTIELGDNTFYNPIEKKIYCKNATYLLQNKEMQLLELFINNRDKLLEKSFIEYEIYENNSMTEAALKNILRKLRNKLPKNTIVCNKNSGYIMRSGNF